MEPLILELNNPTNQGQPQKIQELQRQIQVLQREKSAWQTGLDFLSHEQATIRFYGALTLTVKINADWEEDGLGNNPELRLQLLTSLVNNYLALANLGDANFVLRKICLTLAAFYLKDSADWESPVLHLSTCFLRGSFVPQASTEAMQGSSVEYGGFSYNQLRGILLFSATLAEEGSRLDSGLKGGSLQSRLAGNSRDVLALHLSLLQASGGRLQDTTSVHFPNSSREELQDLTRLVFDQFSSWILLFLEAPDRNGITDASKARVSLHQCLELLFSSYNDPGLADPVIMSLNTLIQSLSSSITRRWKAQVREIILSHHANACISSMLEGDVSSEGHHFLELLTNLVEGEDLSSPEYLDSTCLSQVLPIFQRLMRCQGVPAIDEEVSQIVIEHLNYIADGYADWDGPSEYSEQMRGMILEVCRTCVFKVQYPSDEMSRSTCTWDSDDRIKFRDFRNDVLDFLRSAYAGVGQPVVQLVVSMLLDDQAQADPIRFEAGMFCVSAFVDSMSPENSAYDLIIDAIFRSQQWRVTIQNSQDILDQARQAVIGFLAQINGYFKRHHEQLVPALNFLFSSLDIPHSTRASAKAINALCQSHRTTLANAWPQIVGFLANSSGLNGPNRHRLFTAVASIIEGIEAEEGKVEPLTQILHLIETTLKTQSVSSKQNTMSDDDEGDEDDDDGEMSPALDALQSLAAVGRGVKTPPDVAVDLEEQDGQLAYFWTLGPGRVVQDRAAAICSSVLSTPEASENGDIVRAACDFIKSGYAEQHPSPFKFRPETSVHFLTSLIRPDQPNIEAVFPTTTSFLSSTSPVDLGSENFAHLLHRVMDLQNHLFQTAKSTGHQPDSSFTTSLFDFLNRLVISTKWCPIWFSLSFFPAHLRLTLDLALLVLADPDTLPRRSAASLLSAVLDVSSSSSSSTTSVLLHPYLPAITANLLHLLAGECTRSELDPLTAPLRSLLLLQPRPSVNVKSLLIQAAVDPTAGVLSPQALRATTPDLRSRFVAQIDYVARSAGATGTRRKLLEVVREFWGACRGGEGRVGWIE